MVIMSTPHRRRTTRPSGFSSSLSVALFASIVAYCVVSLIAGRAGLLAERDLSLRMQEMRQRIGELESDNLALRTASESLKFDGDRIAREARDLGYIRKGEKIVVMSNLPGKKSDDLPKRSVNEVLTMGDSSGLPDSVVKTLALITGLAILGASLLMSVKPRRTALKEAESAD
ncbi:MAG: septum formation initiator family protein [Rectinema sp.]